MNSKIKMFVFLVVLGFGSSILFTTLWDNHGHCIENGMMPDFSNKDNCIEFGTPQAFGLSEELISGFSSIDPPISEITPRKPTELKILFQYTSGPYAIDNLVPIIEITPESAVPFVQIETKPSEITQREIHRISAKLIVDEQIPHEKIFLSISFAGNHFLSSSDVLYKSSWTESLTLDIAPKDLVGIALGDCEPMDIDYEISGGKTSMICKSQDANSVKAFVDANSNGTLTLDIPKHVLYALGSTDCRLDNDFFVLYDSEEIISNITGKESSNLVEVDFTSGLHEIEIVGAYIIPDPSPIQYCGIVENYDKLFLAPLDQTQRGMNSHQIKCNDDLVLIQKQNDTPACVKFSTGDKLIKREWATCSDDISYKRGHPCGPRSSGVISFDSYKIADITNHPTIDESAKCGPGTYLIDGICVKNEDTRGSMEPEPEPECKPEPRPENEGGLWIFDYEKCEWNQKQWWMSDQLEKIIQDCLDPENKTGSKGMSNGTTKLKTTTCTWQHGGFYNQVYVEEWADPVPLIQDNKIIGPDGQIFKILED